MGNRRSVLHVVRASCANTYQIIILPGAFAHPSFLEEKHFQTLKRTFQPFSALPGPPTYTIAAIDTGRSFCSVQASPEHVHEVPRHRSANTDLGM